MEVDIDRLSVDTEMPYKKKLNSSGSEIEVEFHPSESIVNQTKNAVFMYEGSNSISKDIEILSKYVRIRFLDKEKNRVLLDKQVERGKEYTINIMDNEIDNPGNYLKLDENGMAIGFKISDGEWGPDMDHKETFRRVIWEDTEVECEMLRFIAFLRSSTSIVINDRITDISNGAVGFSDYVTIESFSSFYNNVFYNVNIENRTLFKYYCGRRLRYFSNNLTSFATYNPSSNDPRVKSIPNTIFKYCRNIILLTSLINVSYSDITFSPIMLKYLSRLKYVGCLMDYDDSNDDFIYRETSAKISLISGSIFTKNPENSEIITNQDIVNKCLEFIFSEYMPKSVIHVESIINGYNSSTFNRSVYLDIKYTGDKRLVPLTSVKTIGVICQTLNSFDSSLLKLFPNLENYRKIGYYYSKNFKRFDDDAFNSLSNLKSVDDFRRNVALTDITFKNNKNLETIIGSVVSPNDVFTIDVFKNNPKIKNLNFLFINSLSDTYIDNINLVLKSFAKYCDISNIDGLFKWTNFTSVPDGFYELDKSKITSCKEAFYLAKNLTHLPELWDKSQYPNIVEYSKCFYDCTAADNYDQVPEGWK